MKEFIINISIDNKSFGYGVVNDTTPEEFQGSIEYLFLAAKYTLEKEAGITLKEIANTK